MQTVSKHDRAHTPGFDVSDIQIARMSDAERVAEGIKRGVGKLSPAIQAQLKELVTPQALAVAGGFFVAWLVSHAVGIGFVVDAIFLGVGVLAVGVAVFSGIDELIRFGTVAIGARSNQDMDRAATHFAAAVSILGVQAVIALLLRRAPQTFRGTRVHVGPPPGGGFVMKPGLRGVKSMPAGVGETSAWGEITISRLGTSTDRQLAALHEAVHRALTPKLNILRSTRVYWRAASYARSSLITYLEEALAESFAQVSVNGIRGLLTGIVFPVRNGYVTLLNKQVISDVHTIKPFAPEFAGFYLGIVNVKGWGWDAYYSPVRPPE